MRSPSLLSVATVLTLASVASAQPRTVEQPVVYGADDRHEVADADEAPRTLARASIVTLVAKGSLSVQGDQVSFNADTLGDARQLCADERFGEQPAAGFCSGTLIAPDLVLTAGHCVTSEAMCRQTFMVFGYEWDGGLAPIDTSAVFGCRSVITQRLSDSGGRVSDYAVVQLDRPATGYTPVGVVQPSPSLSPGDGMVLIGAPSGLPMKVDDGGRVRDARSSVGDYLVATTDTFGGNSGSGVFLPGSLELFGVLISGAEDYVADGSCARVNVCPEDGCNGENILYAQAAIDALCAVATDEVLCGTTSVCGDGFCAFDESASDCAQDCAAPTCGDGVCSNNEWSSCSEDCRVTVPASWTCPDAYYGTLDGCDCGCGAIDPDCALGQEVVGCEFGQTCSDEGTCEGDLASLCEDCAASPARTRTGILTLALLLGCALTARWFGLRRGAA